MVLTGDQIQQLKELINSQLVDLKQQLILVEESSKTVELDQTMMGRVSRIDAIQQQKIAQAGLERDKLHCLQLTKALKLIGSEDYGYCFECDNEIGFSRLSIKPESIYCVSCQQNLEL